MTEHATKYFEGIGGPRRLPILGSAYVLLAPRPWHHLAELVAETDGVAAVYIGHRPLLIVSRPDVIGEILEDRALELKKVGGVKALAPISGDDFVFLANDAAWSALREGDPLLNAAFFHGWAPTLDALVADAWSAEILALAAGGNHADGLTALRRAMFHVFCRVFAGSPLDAHFDDFMVMADVGSHRIFNALEIFGPLPGRFHEAKRRLVGAIVERVRASETEAGKHFAAAWHQHRAGAVDADALGHWITNQLFAGVFSATSAMLGTLLQLRGAHLDAVRAALASGGSAPLRSVVPLEQAIRESLRLVPPVPLLTRSAPDDHDLTLAGALVPPGTQVVICGYGTHRDPKGWEDPASYRPDRWTAEMLAPRGEGSRGYGSAWFFPFGRGPRACLGAELALALVRRGVASMVTAVDFVAPTPENCKEDFFFAVLSLSPGAVTLRPR